MFPRKLYQREHDGEEMEEAYHECWPLIGRDLSRDLNTGLWLAKRFLPQSVHILSWKEVIENYAFWDLIQLKKPDATEIAKLLRFFAHIFTIFSKYFPDLTRPPPLRPCPWSPSSSCSPASPPPPCSWTRASRCSPPPAPGCPGPCLLPGLGGQYFEEKYFDTIKLKVKRVVFENYP